MAEEDQEEEDVMIIVGTIIDETTIVADSRIILEITTEEEVEEERIIAIQEITIVMVIVAHLHSMIARDHQCIEKKDILNEQICIGTTFSVVVILVLLFNMFPRRRDLRYDPRAPPMGVPPPMYDNRGPPPHRGRSPMADRR
jgi:hypothetical protein